MKYNSNKILTQNANTGMFVEVLDSALTTQWNPLIGRKVRIKKRLKNKTHVYIFGFVTSIPNEHLDFH